MEIPVGNFAFSPSEHFTKELERVKKRDPEGYKRVLKTIERLLASPEEADGKLSGPHRGLLKKYVGRSEYRLVYNWCRTCRKANEKLKDHCRDCDAIPDDSVVFLDLFHKSDATKLGY
ncbi:MAG: toxin [Deltaproteobacteria bacterium]|nr:MAG: toxin [Deltaproteobacteria bacterium]